LELEKRFPQKRVLITGANSGFGKAMAMHFGRKGWRVAVTGRRPDAIQAAARDVRDAGAAEAIEMTIDVSKAGDFEAAARRIEEQWGGLDILVNNAGIMDSAKLQDITLEQWRRIVEINFWGVVYGCHAFVPILIRQKSGYVLNMASSAGLFALPEMAHYSVPKAAVIALSETMKAELARYGIGVTVSCPAAFASEILNKEGVDLNRSVTLRSLDRDVQKGRHTSETVAAHAIRSMQRNRLYDIAHDSMEFLWFVKRLMPETIYRLFAWMYANKKWRFKDG
jgi:NAD(P)-dependent dehydrogenase (short-subunit alcohol dehydrogenase family)